MAAPVLVWFRRDLRVGDHPALRAAADDDAAVIPVYLPDVEEQGNWPIGGAAKWWLHHSLKSLAEDLDSRGSRLIIRPGESADALRALVRESGASAVFWNRSCDPTLVEIDDRVQGLLDTDGCDTVIHRGDLLFDPDDVQTQDGGPYQVFTPFWKKCRSLDPPESPLPAPAKLAAPESWPDSVEIDELNLLPARDWADGFGDVWSPGRRGAHRRLDDFLESSLVDYSEQRDRPANEGTSRLSPHLHFGEISPRQVWHDVSDKLSRMRSEDHRKSAETFLSEIGWREFAHHLLRHFPETPDTALRERYRQFEWRDAPDELKAWQRGRTGYPLVDAGMRQLWQTGWMHNRVRMVVASFLTKDLLLPWQEGARWFQDTLVDADLANNTLGWQWAAGCGADAAPFFRIFNPVSQSEKFDPEGRYIREWVPELADLPVKWRHRPWEAPADVLEKAGVKLGETYPEPIVDHQQARRRALDVFEALP